MLLQVFELREELEHLFFYDLYILIQKLLDGVGAEVEEHGEMLQGHAVSRLVHVHYVWEHLCQIVVDVVIQLPLSLAEEVPEDDELVNIDEQLLADALQQSFEGILEVVILTEGFLDEGFDELLNSMEFGLQVPGVEFGVVGGVDL